MKRWICFGTTLIISIFILLCLLNNISTVNINGSKIKNKNIDMEMNEYVTSNYKVFDEDILNQYVFYNYDISDIKDRGVITKVFDYIKNKKYKIDVTYSINGKLLTARVKSMNKYAVKPKNSKIVYKNDKFIVKEGNRGNYIDVKKILKKADGKSFNIPVESCYQTAKITKEDLQNECERLNAISNISYSNGKTIKLTPEMFTCKKGRYIVNREKLKEKIYEILNTYNTVGSEWLFKDENNKKRKVKGGTWGTTVDYEKELDFVCKRLNKGKTIKNRKPLCVSSRETFTEPYIIINIRKQHLWLKSKGKVIMESDVVTGNPNNGHATPTGVYFISECINGKYLVGDNYKTWVDKWMRLTNDGVGLHDAPWQSAFGGIRYKSGYGSHGCINLPPAFSSKLFDKAFVGMTVIIY